MALRRVLGQVRWQRLAAQPARVPPLLQHLQATGGMPAEEAMGEPTSAGRPLTSAAADASSQTAVIKQLRERTGAPMLDVKRVLMSCDWDMEAAFRELRKKGLAEASKKAGRVAAEGLIGVEIRGQSGTIVEVNCETDFVARNEKFQNLVSAVARSALPLPSMDAVQEIPVFLLEGTRMPAGTFHGFVGDAVAEAAATVREHIRLRRSYRISASPNGVLASYLHTVLGPNLARMAAIVALLPSKKPADPTALKAVGEKLAMHIVAARPLFLSRSEVTSEALEAEKEVLRSQALESGKPPDVVEKILQGRLRKYYEDVVLMEQNFIMDDKKKVGQYLEEAGKELGTKVTVEGFVRLQCGEGIEKKEKDFAAEVAAYTKGARQ